LANVRLLESKFGIIESNQAICETFGKLKAMLIKRGEIIAACALVTDFTFVTNNQRHFKRIKGLKIENWI